APWAATIRSQASAISIPPATAKPSIAAISGLSAARCAMPAKPRSPYQGDSPFTNAPRSIPAQKKPPAPVSTPTDSSGSASSSSSALPTPSASAALTALRTSGRLRVIRRTLPRFSVRTAVSAGASTSVLIAAPSVSLPRGAYPGSGSEERQVGLAFAAHQRKIDLDAVDPARGGEHGRLGLDRLRGEHPAAAAHRRVQADALEVARQLLDRVDRADALDLHGDPLVLDVPAHQIDRADVRRPLAAHEPQALAAPLGRVGEQLLEFALDPLLLEAQLGVERMIDV